MFVWFVVAAFPLEDLAPKIRFKRSPQAYPHLRRGGFAGRILLTVIPKVQAKPASSSPPPEGCLCRPCPFDGDSKGSSEARKLIPSPVGWLCRPYVPPQEPALIRQSRGGLSHVMPSDSKHLRTSHQAKPASLSPPRRGGFAAPMLLRKGRRFSGKAGVGYPI